MKKKLTIILAIKNRPNYALRWMRFANEQCFPYKIIIADGGLNDKGEKIFQIVKKFPNLTYEYKKYRPDINYMAYYEKISNAISLVNTEYTLMADEDDFFCVDGINKSIEFLDNNSDYIGARGNYNGFSVEKIPNIKSNNENELYGKFKPKGIIYPSITYDQEKPDDRLIKYFAEWTPVWYNILRTKNIRRSWNQMMALDIKDIFLQEHVVSGLLVIQGKMYSGSYPYYFRQFGESHMVYTTSGAAYAKDGDMLDRMLTDAWQLDYWKMINEFASDLIKELSVVEYEARETARRAYKKFHARGLTHAINVYSMDIKSRNNRETSFLIIIKKKIKNIYMHIDRKKLKEWQPPEIKNFLCDMKWSN